MSHKRLSDIGFRRRLILPFFQAILSRIMVELKKIHRGITEADPFMETILVIDDDRELCALLAEYLTPEGFLFDAAYDGETGIEMVLSENFSIILLDIMLPGGQNGFDVIQRIRAKSSIPIIMLTAKGDDVDRILGLEMGADDYLSKPFNPRELLARIRSVLRRSKIMQQEMTASVLARKYRFGDVELDLGARVVLRANETVKLTNVEFKILEVLMRNYGSVVSRDDLAMEVLERPLSSFDRSIDVHVSNLRKKLGRESDGSDRITAIRGAGYMYVCSSLSREGADPSLQNSITHEDDSHAEE
jgi:DNA-binding response OmpR family regulator